MKLSILSLLVTGTVGIDMSILIAGPCFENLSEISEFEFGCVFEGTLLEAAGLAPPDNCPVAFIYGSGMTFTTLRNTKRTYTVCPNSTFLSPPTLSLGTGDLPLGTVNPNLEIKCGNSGESSNNCVIKGGAVQFVAPHPFFIGLTTLPRDAAKLSMLDISNLQISGLTFTGLGEGIENLDGDNTRSLLNLSLSLPGNNILIKDCVFKDNAVEHTMALLFVEEVFNAKNVPVGTDYQSVTLDGIIIKNTEFFCSLIQSTVLESPGGWTNAPLGPDRSSHVVVRNSFIGNNKGFSLCYDQTTHGVFDLDDGANTIDIESSCFIDNCGPQVALVRILKDDLYTITDDVVAENNSFSECEFLQTNDGEKCVSTASPTDITAINNCRKHIKSTKASNCPKSPKSSKNKKSTNPKNRKN